MTSPVFPVRKLVYDDEVSRWFTIAAVFCCVVELAVVAIIALQLSFHLLNFDLPWTNFGRLGPLYTSDIIFAFGGSVLISSSFLWCIFCGAEYLPSKASLPFARALYILRVPSFYILAVI